MESSIANEKLANNYPAYFSIMIIIGYNMLFGDLCKKYIFFHCLNVPITIVSFIHIALKEISGAFGVTLQNFDGRGGVCILNQ